MNVTIPARLLAELILGCGEAAAQRDLDAQGAPDATAAALEYETARDYERAANEARALLQAAELAEDTDPRLAVERPADTPSVGAHDRFTHGF